MKRIFLLLTVILCAVPLCANMSAVGFSNLPQDEVFQQKFEKFLSNIKYIQSYTPEWNFPITKDEVKNIVMDFEFEIEKQETPSVDLEVLHLIIMRYLYNIDAQDYSKKIEEKVENLKKEYPNDYRFSWIYGNYLVSSIQIIKGIGEFTKIIDSFQNLTSLHPAFLEDYSYSCMLSFMYKKGFLALEAAAQLRNIEITNYWLYDRYLDLLKKPRPYQTYDQNVTWKLQKNVEEIKLFSHILGASIPVEGDWNLNFTGLDQQQSYVKIFRKIPSIKEREIGVSVLMLFSVKEIPYSDFQTNFTSSVPAVKKEERTINGVVFTVWTYENPETYVEMGGSKGLCVSAEIPASKTSNFNIEFPYEIHLENQKIGASYYSLTNAYDRIERTVRVGILLDSCTEVFTESSEFFWKLIEGCIFE